MAAIILSLALAMPRQDAAVDIHALFEAGSYRQVVEAVAGSPTPTSAELFVGALSHQQLGDAEAATLWLDRLAAMPDDDPWHFVGLSAVALAEGRSADALAPAGAAVELADGLPYAHFQHGLALAGNQSYEASAAAFERVVAAVPRSAYGHYYAGLAYARIRRIDKTAGHFEAFLTLAPDAPERAEVASIMRAVRGR